MDSTKQQAAEVLALLDAAQRVEVAQLQPLMAEAVRATVRLRDGLIAARRQGAGDEAALRTVNVALSLLVGVENPLEGVKWEWIEQVRRGMKELGERFTP